MIQPPDDEDFKPQLDDDEDEDLPPVFVRVPRQKLSALEGWLLHELLDDPLLECAPHLSLNHWISSRAAAFASRVDADPKEIEKALLWLLLNRCITFGLDWGPACNGR